MASREQLLAYTASGRSICSHTWHMDEDNPDVVYNGFPMYFNRTTSGCGRQNIGNRPRIEGSASWTTSAQYACACAPSDGA